MSHGNPVERLKMAKENTERKKMSKKYSNVVELMRDIADKDFCDELDKEIQRKRISKVLFVVKCAREITDEDITKKTGWQQGKITFFENQPDVDIALDDLLVYCAALGLNANVELYSSDFMETIPIINQRDY